MFLPISLSLLNATFTGKARSQAFAVWGSTIGAAATLGPLFGGWLAEHFSWRRAFGINVPLAVLIVIGVLLFLAASPRNRGRIDATGAVLSALGLGLLAFGLIEGRTYGWFSTTTPLQVVRDHRHPVHPTEPGTERRVGYERPRHGYRRSSIPMIGPSQNRDPSRSTEPHYPRTVDKEFREPPHSPDRGRRALPASHWPIG